MCLRARASTTPWRVTGCSCRPPLASIRRTHTPLAAIVAQAVWSVFLVLTGSFAQLVNYTGFTVVLFAGIAVLALFVLRRREPDAPRPFKALGYPVAPGLFVIASAAMVINAIWREPLPSLGGMAILAAGIPVYWLFQRRVSSPDGARAVRRATSASSTSTPRCGSS